MHEVDTAAEMHLELIQTYILRILTKIVTAFAS